ncbi:MAG: Protein of unknown function (Porph_ging) [Bacteroidetes bacterium ADurb.BinA174]|nr:MAG: Protein of unknown function (Porph_ging) [Bacteroidetes bacterium ADurb.BinA174]
MRHLIIIISLLFLKGSIAAQEQWNWQPLDTAYLVCQYEYSYPRIFSTSKDDMRLEIGRNISKFYSRITFEYDSLFTTTEGRLQVSNKVKDILRKTRNVSSKEEEMSILKEIPSQKTNSIIYKNYPKGKILVQDKVSTAHLKYEDDYKPQEWKILADTMNHLSYSCQKATCTWRGRDYVAWFTPEIPVNDGPMKFFGLPGLIVIVEDTENEYRFTLIGIQKASSTIFLNAPLAAGVEVYSQSSRETVLKEQQKRLRNILRANNRDFIQSGITTDYTEEDIPEPLERDF